VALLTLGALTALLDFVLFEEPLLTFAAPAASALTASEPTELSAEFAESLWDFVSGVVVVVEELVAPAAVVVSVALVSDPVAAFSLANLWERFLETATPAAVPAATAALCAPSFATL